MFFGSTYNELDKESFENFKNNLSQTAEGHEIWKQLYGAWEKKNKRDKNKEIKFYSFELKINVKKQLDELSKGSTIKKTIEDLISSAYQENKLL